MATFTRANSVDFYRKLPSRVFDFRTNTYTHIDALKSSALCGGSSGVQIGRGILSFSVGSPDAIIIVATEIIIRMDL